MRRALALVGGSTLLVGCHELAGLGDLTIAETTTTSTTAAGGTGGNGASGGAGAEAGSGGFPAATVLAAVSIGDAFNQYGAAIASADGGLALAGSNGGTIATKSKTQTIVASDSDDLFVARLDPELVVLEGHSWESFQLLPLVATSGSDLILAITYSSIKFSALQEYEAKKSNVAVVSVGLTYAVADPTLLEGNSAVWSRGLSARGSEVAVVGHYGANIASGCPDAPFPDVKDGSIAHLFAARLDSKLECQDALAGGGSTILDEQEAMAVAIDHDGAAVFAGTFKGVLGFSSGQTAGSGERRAFVAKVSPDGVVKWTKTFGAGTGASGVVRAVAVTPNNDVVVAGDFVGTFDFGFGPVQASPDGVPKDAIGAGDAFVARCAASSGAPQWARIIGGAGSQVARAVTVSGTTGHVTVAGDFTGTLDIEGATYESAGGSAADGGGGDVFVVQLDTDSGEPRWASTFGDAKTQIGRSLASAQAGTGIYLAGDMYGSFQAGTFTLASPGGATNIFVMRLDEQ